MIFDTHAHYDSAEFDEDRDTLLPQMHEDGICAIVNVGASFAGVEKSQALAERWPFVYAAAGVHPDHVGELDEAKMQRMKDLCAKEKTVAVGEIGLDYYWDKEPREVQKEWFIRQLRLSQEVGLPVIIHSRNAAQETFDIMKAVHAGSTGGVIHCFSGSAQMAVEYVKMGYYIGIGGVVTFKNGRVMKEVAAAVPLERILLETDAPYLAPVPYRGKRNQSGYLPLVAQEIAAIRGITPEEVENTTRRNACALFLRREEI